MFLPWVGKCELLQSPPEAHVLKGFNERCQRGICTMVVGFLGTQSAMETNSNGSQENNENAMEVLSTPTHMKWAMEALGHSFALGMDDGEVIYGAIRIYEKWLGLSAVDARPKCMMKEEQEFIQDLIGHMSMLFDDRTEKQELFLAKQVSLCQKYCDCACIRLILSAYSRI